MNTLRHFVSKALVTGTLLALPVYLALLLVLRAMKSLGGLVRPIAALLPSALATQAAESALALLLVVLVCFALGVVIQTRPGRAARELVEKSVLTRIPGYTLLRGLTLQLVGQGETVWQPALAEMAGGLVPAFIIEQLADGRYTVFIPSAPSPVRGAVYVLARERVHPINATFAQTFKAVSRWGSGVGSLVAALDAAEPREAEAQPSRGDGPAPRSKIA